MGTIAVGKALEVFTDTTEEIDFEKEIEQQGAYALLVNGQSMIDDHICNKDYVIIKPQNTCENGDVVVAVHLQGNGRATLKRYIQEEERDRVRLYPLNSGLEPINVSKSEWDRYWQIQGKVLAVFRKFDSKNHSVSSRRLRVFLCHSSGDKLFVRELYKRLKDCNLDPWLDEENILPGQDWDQEIRKAVREADAVIVCLSRGSISKTGYVQKEIKFALDIADEKPDGTTFLIPLKLEECIVPQRLSRWQWVKYFEQDGFDKLMKTLTLNISV